MHVACSLGRVRDFADEQLQRTCRLIAESAREYEKTASLQTEPIENYEELSDSVHRVTFLSGRQIITNYSYESVILQDGTVIPPEDYIIV